MQPKSIVSRARWKRKTCASSIYAKEGKEFWSKLWDNQVPYKEDTESLKEVELQLENVNIQDKKEITKKDITMQLRNMPNWRATG